MRSRRNTSAQKIPAQEPTPHTESVAAPADPAPPRPEAGSIVARLFASHGGRIRRLIQSRLQNLEDAQDAAQEVFLKLWSRERAGALREEADAYLHSAAHTVVIDMQRHRRSHAADLHVELDEEELPSTHGPDDPLHWRKGLVALVYCMQELPELTQQIFILYHFEGMDHKAIAHRLDISVRSVERHMAHALAHGRVGLKDYL